MPRRKFKYDVVKLMESVRERPCIWDKRLDSYKDRLERRAAWEEIFVILEPNYESMSEDAKQTTGEQILNKWTNVRDHFVKTLRKKLSGVSETPYFYYKHIEFLKDVIDSKEWDYSSVMIENYEVEPAQESDGEPKKHRLLSKGDTDDEATKHGAFTIKKSKKVKTENSESYDYDHNIDFVGVNSLAPPTDRLMNEDEAFFASLLPTVVKYNEDERLEFRIEVLKLMKRIKQQSSQQAEMAQNMFMT